MGCAKGPQGFDPCLLWERSRLGLILHLDLLFVSVLFSWEGFPVAQHSIHSQISPPWSALHLFLLCYLPQAEFHEWLTDVLFLIVAEDGPCCVQNFWLSCICSACIYSLHYFFFSVLLNQFKCMQMCVGFEY